MADLADALRIHRNDIKDEVYINKMQEILCGYPHLGVPPYPTKIFDHVYLGTSANADNIPMLRGMGINYILNCAELRSVLGRPCRKSYSKDTGILGYKELYPRDEEHYKITMDFPLAFSFLDRVKSKGGTCLVCCPGVSRSSAIYIGYMVNRGVPLLEAVRQVKEARRTVLSNPGFVSQLVTYARERDALDQDVSEYKTRGYGGPMDTYRLTYSHLPLFV